MICYFEHFVVLLQTLLVSSLRFESNVSNSFPNMSRRVSNYSDILNIPTALELLSQLLFGYVEREISNENRFCVIEFFLSGPVDSNVIFLNHWAIKRKSFFGFLLDLSIWERLMKHYIFCRKDHVSVLAWGIWDILSKKVFHWKKKSNYYLFEDNWSPNWHFVILDRNRSEPHILYLL